MYKVSPTLLDSYRLYRDADFKTYDELVSGIKRIAGETTQMLLGRAFHKLKEGFGLLLSDGNYSVDGFVFSGIIAGDENLLSEMRTQYMLETRYGSVQMNMVADGVRGRTITEYKTTQSTIDVVRYLDYYQWRCYLLGFESDKVIYDITELQEKKGVWVAHDWQQVDFYPYQGIEADIRILAEDFISFCVGQNLSAYITVADENV